MSTGREVQSSSAAYTAFIDHIRRIFPDPSHTSVTVHAEVAALDSRQRIAVVTAVNESQKEYGTKASFKKDWVLFCPRKDCVGHRKRCGNCGIRIVVEVLYGKDVLQCDEVAHNSEPCVVTRVVKVSRTWLELGAKS